MDVNAHEHDPNLSRIDFPERTTSTPVQIRHFSGLGCDLRSTVDMEQRALSH